MIDRHFVHVFLPKSARFERRMEEMYKDRVTGEIQSTKGGEEGVHLSLASSVRKYDTHLAACASFTPRVGGWLKHLSVKSKLAVW